MFAAIHTALRATLLAVMTLLMGGCAATDVATPAPQSTAKGIDALGPVDFLLIGEQHDAPEHQRIEREAVEALAAQGLLAALAIEMAEQGQDTRRLSASASDEQVRAALRWSEPGWPWKAYGPVVMAAVRAGVPVLGANLPRMRMKDAMIDVSLDAQLEPQALAAQQDAVREGHCGALPEVQIHPMTRIQIARDRAMAQTLIQARQPGKTVLLISGAGHNARVLGVPQHLPLDFKVRSLRLAAGEPQPSAGKAAAYDAVWLTPALPPKDYCAEFRAMRR